LVLAACTRPSLKIIWRTSALALVVGVILSAPRSHVSRNDNLERALACAASDATSAFIASTELGYAFPFVLKHNLAWASRLPAQWTVPYMAANGTRGNAVADATLQWSI
jgi:hypothetical protein